MFGPANNPYLRELGRRALVDLLGAVEATRILDGPHPDLLDDDATEDFAEPQPAPDPVLADFYGGTSVRALADARDGLAVAKVRYAEAVNQARAAGWTWPEIARVLGVSRQALHNRFRNRPAG